MIAFSIYIGIKQPQTIIIYLSKRKIRTVKFIFLCYIITIRVILFNTSVVVKDIQIIVSILKITDKKNFSRSIASFEAVYVFPIQ